MLDDQSLGLFLKSLNVDNLVIGDGGDGWIYIAHVEYDDALIARSYSYTNDQFEPIAIEHIGDSGKFVHPTYHPVKNISYQFNAATWTGDHFDINITIEKDDISHTDTFPLDLIKSMIDSAPKKRTTINRLIEHFQLF